MATPLLLSVFSLLPLASQAATLAGTVNTAPSNSVDLTASGTSNWAVWNYTASNSGPTLGPSNTLSGAPTVGNSGYISGISRVGSSGSTNVRGGNASTVLFSYSNGASPASFGPAISGMVFQSNLDVNNQGVSLSVTGDPGQLYQVSVWASGLAGMGQMTATLSGATAVVLNSQVYTDADSGNGAKGATLFTYTFQPDLVTDTLNLSYVLLNQTAGTNSHVGISAVAVSVIPEPSSAMALLAGLGTLGLVRRRH